MNSLNELLDEIFDNKQPAFHDEFQEWVVRSRRFREFAMRYRTKIRAKLKNVRDDGGMQDVRAELETAALLLRVEQFTLEYEKYAATKQRGPDFTVTFRTHTPFNVEVRRIRTGELGDGKTDAHIFKLILVLCDKVGQMPPSSVNLLWLKSERELSEADLNRALTMLRQLADSKHEEFFTRRGYDSAAHFLKQYHRLSGIVLRQADKRTLWLNPVARHKLPSEIATQIQRLASL